MTENQAIGKMKYRIKTATDAIGKGVDGKAYEDMEIAIKALERRMPKKPVKHDNCGNKCASERCPNCFKIVSGKYCENCGQHLKWEESENGN